MLYYWLKMAKTPNLLSPKEKLMEERNRKKKNRKGKSKIKEKQEEERLSQSRGLAESGHQRILVRE